MNDILKKDITMKAISVLIAVILWFMVLDQSNPYETMSIKVPLNVLNQGTLLDKNIKLKNLGEFPLTVEVSLHGRHEKISSFSESDFSATIDLSKIKDHDIKTMKINTTYIGNGKDAVKLNKDVTFSYFPKEVSLDMESVENNTYLVNVNTTGKMKENYKIIKIDTAPDVIALEGTDSLLKTVGTIKAGVDVTGLDKDLDTKVKCVVIDKNKKDITKYFNKIFVNVKIAVAKEVIVDPVIAGTPAPNYLNTTNTPNPERVLITGPYNVVSKINHILTTPISIENQSQNTILTSQLVLPEGITLVNSPEEVTVNLGIEPLAKKTFTFSAKDIMILNPEIDNSLKYEVTTPEITVEIKGTRNELDKLDISNIAPAVDVYKQIEGSYQLPLKVTLPQTVRLSQDYLLDVSVTKR